MGIRVKTSWIAKKAMIKSETPKSLRQFLNFRELQFENVKKLMRSDEKSVDEFCVPWLLA